ncbi:MAG: TetR/AcrR family transcriptional regulator [Parvularculaceae bacterium]|nr:TetR/AcrR family transcriptional regulator [Parvularculaceae bacterium]
MKVIQTKPISPKQRQILEAALALLSEVGGTGLSMRKLAERADMRLSNVQYYFPSRDDVLRSMVQLYFEECTDSIHELTAASDATTTEERLRYLVRLGLSHGETLSEMCKIFRELWAVAGRNEAVHDCLMDYYRGFADVVSIFIVGREVASSVHERVKAILIPYFEGYSIAAPSLSLSVDEVEDMLFDMIMQNILSN